MEIQLLFLLVRKQTQGWLGEQVGKETQSNRKHNRVCTQKE